MVQVLIVSILFTYFSTEKGNLADVAPRVREVETKVESLQQMIKAIPGIDLSEQQQCTRIRTLVDQISAKNQLIDKYRNKAADLFD